MTPEEEVLELARLVQKMWDGRANYDVMDARHVQGELFGCPASVCIGDLAEAQQWASRIRARNALKGLS